MRSPLARTVAVALFSSMVLAACGGPAPVEMPAAESPDDVYGGFTVDPPARDEVVLTLVGAIEVDLTMAELEARATTEVRFVEPFVQAEQTFTVVPLAELFALAGIGADDTVDTIALNDYRYRDTVAALLASGALLAVGRDGGPIPMNAGGPIRLVFAEDSAYHGNLDAWNWSLRTIVVVRTD
jgi:hypothetical protein